MFDFTGMGGMPQAQPQQPQVMPQPQPAPLGQNAGFGALFRNPAAMGAGGPLGGGGGFLQALMQMAQARQAQPQAGMMPQQAQGAPQMPGQQGMPVGKIDFSRF